MTESFYDISKSELIDKNMVDIPWLNERICASVGGHLMNRYNLSLFNSPKNRLNAFYDCGRLDNFRLHVVLMMPSGFGKTSRMDFYLNPKHGLLRDCDYLTTSMRGTFSSESWAGTRRSSKVDEDGNPIVVPGLFERYKDGILGADEFMRFVGMMDTSKVDNYSNEEVYLLKGLDSSTITKDLAVGEINVCDIGTTLWVGSRFAKLDMKHGLARRVLFHLFTPTPDLAEQFRILSRKREKAKAITDKTVKAVNKSLEASLMSLKGMDCIDYSALHEFIDKEARVPHFEELLLRRIAVGFSIARNTLPEIVMDDTMKGLIKDEIRNREIIREDPEYEIVRNILREQHTIRKKKLHDFLSSYYQFTRDHYRKLLTNMISMGELVIDGDNYRLKRKSEKNVPTIGKLNFGGKLGK